MVLYHDKLINPNDRSNIKLCKNKLCHVNFPIFLLTSNILEFLPVRTTVQWLVLLGLPITFLLAGSKLTNITRSNGNLH